MEPIIITRIVIAILLSLGIAVIYTGLIIGAALLYTLPPMDEE